MQKIFFFLLSFVIASSVVANSPSINMFNNQVAAGIDVDSALTAALAVSTDEDIIDIAQAAVASAPEQAPSICASIANQYPDSIQSIVFTIVESAPAAASDIAKSCAEQVPSESAVIAASAIAAAPEQAESIILAVSDVIFVIRDNANNTNQIALSSWEAENVRRLPELRTGAYIPEPMPISERNFRASASPN